MRESKLEQGLWVRTGEIGIRAVRGLTLGRGHIQDITWVQFKNIATLEGEVAHCTHVTPNCVTHIYIYIYIYILWGGGGGALEGDAPPPHLLQVPRLLAVALPVRRARASRP